MNFECMDIWTVKDRYLDILICQFSDNCANVNMALRREDAKCSMSRVTWHETRDTWRRVPRRHEDPPHPHFSRCHEINKYKSVSMCQHCTVLRTFDRGVANVKWELHNSSTNLRLNSVCVCLSTAVSVCLVFMPMVASVMESILQRNALIWC